jgi:hypothetical protein
MSWSFFNSVSCVYLTEITSDLRAKLRANESVTDCNGLAVCILFLTFADIYN